MAMYIAVKREGKWEVLFSHVNGDDLIKRCDTKKQAEALIKVLETGHNVKENEMKYYLGSLNITLGEYEVDTAIRFSANGNPRLKIHDIAEDFYGNCYCEDDGTYYFNGGEVAVEVGCFEEVSKEVFDSIPNQIAPVLWGKREDE
jgi:hypothetical protein